MFPNHGWVQFARGISGIGGVSRRGEGVRICCLPLSIDRGGGPPPPATGSRERGKRALIPRAQQQGLSLKSIIGQVTLCFFSPRHPNKRESKHKDGEREKTEKNAPGISSSLIAAAASPPPPPPPISIILGTTFQPFAPVYRSLLFPEAFLPARLT